MAPRARPLQGSEVVFIFNSGLMEDWDEESGETAGGEGEVVDFMGAPEAAGDVEEELIGEVEEGHRDGGVGAKVLKG